MNLGLDAPVPQAAKRQAVGMADKDMKQILAVVTKQTLANSEEVRMLKGCLYDVYRLPAQSDCVMNGLAATEAFATKAKEFTGSDDRLKTLGLPRIHLWNSMLGTLLKAYQHKPEQQQFIQEYVTTYEKKGWQAIHQEVHHLRLRKCYDKKYMKLEIRILPSTPSHKLYLLLQEYFATMSEAMRLEGTAPRGVLERKMQDWLNNQSEAV